MRTAVATFNPNYQLMYSIRPRWQLGVNTDFGPRWQRLPCPVGVAEYSSSIFNAVVYWRRELRCPPFVRPTGRRWTVQLKRPGYQQHKSRKNCDENRQEEPRHNLGSLRHLHQVRIAFHIAACDVGSREFLWGSFATQELAQRLPALFYVEHEELVGWHYGLHSLVVFAIFFLVQRRHFQVLTPISCAAHSGVKVHLFVRWWEHAVPIWKEVANERRVIHETLSPHVFAVAHGEDHFGVGKGFQDFFQP